jgi:hypothetical protein
MENIAKYIVKAINDESDYCECCGKKGLKRVVWLSYIDVGNTEIEPGHYGTMCAARMMGYKGITKSKAENILSKELYDSKIEEEENNRLTSHILDKVSYDKSYAIRLFWHYHRIYREGSVKIEDCFLMKNEGDYVMVWKYEVSCIKILEKYGFVMER